MSLFGAHWTIDGVTAGTITGGRGDGRYWVLFERELAELPQIEAIRWDRPTVEHLRTDLPGEQGLPEGCGFQVADITYDSASRSYTVELHLESRYLGDVTAYQAQAAVLTQEAAAARARTEELEQLAAAREGELRAAYERGVESHG